MRPKDTIPEVLACLLRRLGLQVQRRLLDKGFWSIPVLHQIARSAAA